MSGQSLLVLGAGSLARAICYAFATVGTTQSTVTVASRTPSRAADVCYVAEVRAALAGTSIGFRPQCIRHYSADDLLPLLEEQAPAVVVNCASPQSPWERISSPSAWTDLIATAGFGMTLPLQAAIPIEAGNALLRAHSDALFVNASFPDAVNPLLRHLNLPVFCGIGNVALLEASLRQELGLGQGEQLRVLGHHWHLHPPPSAAEEALAWRGGVRIENVRELLARQRETARQELNVVNGHVTALLLDALLTRREVRMNLPGPHGLPGGYPVRVHDRRVLLDLPRGWTRERAAEANQRWGRHDGVVVDESGKVSFFRRGGEDIGPLVPELAGSLRAGDVPELLPELLALRVRLRKRPPASTPRGRTVG
ncbi:hypothetical protein ABZY93_06420 [Streptomyces smyrnaeus]|uniref:hypothetical protein n=1 Tax=Streptomyces smyrnaeus TaxID=1387713 RepID=UPI0033A1C3D9